MRTGGYTLTILEILGDASWVVAYADVLMARQAIFPPIA